MALNRFQVLTLLAILGSVTFLTLGLLAIGMTYVEAPDTYVRVDSLYWLSIGFWVGFSFYLARAKFRSWGIAALCGLVMLLWFAAGPVILGQFPDVVTYILSDFEWIEHWAANDLDDQAGLVLLTSVGMLPFFIVISLIWALFPMLLASWPSRNNVIQPALA